MMQKYIEKLRKFVSDIFFISLITLFLIFTVNFAIGFFYPGPHPITWQDLSLTDVPHSEAYSYFPWVKDYLADRQKHPDTEGMLYAPYYLWKHPPYVSKYINIGPNGFRVVTNFLKPNVKKHIKIFVFGGSTIYGDGIIRDIDTIPSQLSLMLNEKFTNTNFEVMNYSQSGFSLGNEVHLFIELLSKGEKPDIVIFYDGANDTTNQVALGQAHMSEHEFQRLFTSRWGYELVKKLAARLNIIKIFMSEEDFPDYAFSFIKNEQQLQKNSVSLIMNYTNYMHLVKKLSKEFEFKAFFFWQPNIFTSKKIFTMEEKQLTEKIGQRSPELKQAYAIVDSLIKSELKGHPSFFDISSALDSKAESLFVDFVHINPIGTATVAKTISEIIINTGGP